MPITGPDLRSGMVFQDLRSLPLAERGARNISASAPGSPRADCPGKSRKPSEPFQWILVGLGRLATSNTASAFRGMKQRVANPPPLANEAEVVLMDEPFGALGCLGRGNACRTSCWNFGSGPRGDGCSFRHPRHRGSHVLSGRVIVMSPGPGRIDTDLTVGLQRPLRRLGTRLQRSAT